MSDFDVIVIGGGPAGCYAALTAALKGCKVAIFEEHGAIGRPRHDPGWLMESEFAESIINAIGDTVMWTRVKEYRVCNSESSELIEKRGAEPSRITVAEMDEHKRYNKLTEEGKKYKNAIGMLAYRAETALFNIISEYFKGAQNNGRMLIKEIFSSDADMIPDYQKNTLTIVLHSMSTPRANKAVEKLCEHLNETQTIYPYTQMKMVFKSIAV